MECIKTMRDTLITLAVEELKHPECVNTEEMKDVIKMIKYLQEAIYFYVLYAFQGYFQHLCNLF